MEAENIHEENIKYELSEVDHSDATSTVNIKDDTNKADSGNKTNLSSEIQTQSSSHENAEKNQKRKRGSTNTYPTLLKRKRNEKRIVKDTDYVFATNSSGIENHLLIVREENDRNYAREYLYNKTKFYYCRSCKKNGKAIYAAAHEDLHGKFVVRVPLDDQHCTNCVPVEFEKLVNEAHLRIPQNNQKNSKKSSTIPTTMVNNVNFNWSQVIANQRSVSDNITPSSSLVPSTPITRQNSEDKPQTLQELIEALAEDPVPLNIAENTLPDLFNSCNQLENIVLPFPSVRYVPDNEWYFRVDPNNHYYDGKIIVKDANSLNARVYIFAYPSNNGTIIFKCSCCDDNPFNCNIYLLRDENDKTLAIEFIMIGHAKHCHTLEYDESVNNMHKNQHPSSQSNDNNNNQDA